MCHRLFHTKCSLALVSFVGVALRSTTSAFAPSSSCATLLSACGVSFSNPVRNGIHHRLQSSSTAILRASPSDEDDIDTTDDAIITNSNGKEKEDASSSSLGSDLRRAFLASSLTALTYNIVAIEMPSALGRLSNPGYERVSPLQFVAALGDPDASSGGGAQHWGLWRTDPGPRGLRLRDYERMVGSGSDNNDESSSSAVSRPTWLDDADFFLDENAIIMPPPEFPLPPGKYLVTGARTVTTGLTIDATGNWKLDDGDGDDTNGHTLYDVTHLPCRAARYRRRVAQDAENGSPSTVRRGDFPVAPGGVMPDVPGTDKQIYSVLFIIGKRSV